MLLDAVAGPGPEDSFAAAAARPPGALRIAVSTRTPFPVRLDPELRGAVDATAELLRTLGHAVERHDPPTVWASNAVTPRYLRGIAEDAAARVPAPGRLQRRTRGFARLGGADPGPVLAPRGATRPATRAHQPHLRARRRAADPHHGRPPAGAAAVGGDERARTLLGMIADLSLSRRSGT